MSRHRDEDQHHRAPQEEKVKDHRGNAEHEDGAIGDGEKRPDQACPEQDKTSDQQLCRLHWAGRHYRGRPTGAQRRVSEARRAFAGAGTSQDRNVGAAGVSAGLSGLVRIVLPRWPGAGRVARGALAVSPERDERNQHRAAVGHATPSTRYRRPVSAGRAREHGRRTRNRTRPAPAARSFTMVRVSQTCS